MCFRLLKVIIFLLILYFLLISKLLFGLLLSISRRLIIWSWFKLLCWVLLWVLLFLSPRSFLFWFFCRRFLLGSPNIRGVFLIGNLLLLCISCVLINRSLFCVLIIWNFALILCLRFFYVPPNLLRLFDKGNRFLICIWTRFIDFRLLILEETKTRWFLWVRTLLTRCSWFFQLGLSDFFLLYLLNRFLSLDLLNNFWVGDLLSFLCLLCCFLDIHPFITRIKIKWNL